MGTNVLSHKDIQRNWIKVDVKGKTLGRVATEIATLIIGKGKVSYVPYLDCGDHVVVINAREVKVSGKKETQKVYFRHSGYPGGDKKETLAKLRQRRPEEIIRHAVWGMVPKTRLGRQMIKKLHVFPGSEHDFSTQLNEGAKDAS